MPSDTTSKLLIRPMQESDQPEVALILERVGNFHAGEISCALELVDIYLHNSRQRDYFIVVAEDAEARVRAYACWGPTPLTRGTYDLYWIATDPEMQGSGFGRALMAFVEDQVRKENGRLLILETSSKESYGNTVGFYRRLKYEEASRIRDFYDVGDDKITFVKRFSR
jgi:ribosomal protein S18 acetylase RimI-like enzyme